MDNITELVDELESGLRIHHTPEHIYGVDLSTELENVERLKVLLRKLVVDLKSLSRCTTPRGETPIMEYIGSWLDIEIDLGLAVGEILKHGPGQQE